MAPKLEELIKIENWEIIIRDDNKIILAEGQEFPYTHPFDIHGKLYRIGTSPDEKFRHLKAMHDYAFPSHTWNYWTEERFREHCEDWRIVTWASGGSTGKSFDAAKLGLLYWLAYPKGRTVLIASTTLTSLDKRIWGYMLRFIKEMKVSFKYYYSRSKPPQLLYNRDDSIHGIFALAAKKGGDERTIEDWKGRHPEAGMLIILDECTDMPVALLDAIPNLEKGQEGRFQVLGIGNSFSRYDLHGALSTPTKGWASIDPMKDKKWPTTQDKGVCLFFNCYDSPAIYEADPKRREILSRYLFTKEKIQKDIERYGKDSLKFWQMTLGFWRSEGVEPTVLSKSFLANFNSTARVEWGPYGKIKILAGLDPAFSYGGDNCVLRLARFGINMQGQIILDFMGTELLHYIKTLATANTSIEMQIVDQVLAILKEFGIRLKDLAIDCSGQGRGLADLLRLRANVIDYPLKIYSIQSQAVGKIKKAAAAHEMNMMSNYELWSNVRSLIETDNIRGLDAVATQQFTTRLVEEQNGRILLEKKADYKKRMGAISPVLAVSPDEADAASLVVQVAMRNYGMFPGQMIKALTAEEEQAAYLSRNRPGMLGKVIEAPKPVELHFGRGFITPGIYGGGVVSTKKHVLGFIKGN